MARARNGKAIRRVRLRPKEQRRLRSLLAKAERENDLRTWKRAKAVIDYIAGKRVVALSEEFGVARSTINRWFKRFNESGTRGLRARKRKGASPRLTVFQRGQLQAAIDAGPLEAGFDTGIWTSPMIGDWIQRTFDVNYHKHYVPRLLHRLGFSVQRPRKRLARADKARQERWINERLPTIKKSLEM